MANYNETARTNYFRVTDEKRYQELFSKLIAEDEIYDWTKTDENGIIWHAFGSYGCIEYEVDEDNWNRSEFFKELQKILPDGEAFIFMASGYEKLRYVTGYSIIVTNKEIQNIDIVHDALNKARAMLHNANWNTQTEY